MSKQSSQSRDWPLEGLEHLGACPICAGEQRHGVHQGLADHLFNAPGRWDLHACEKCGTAYLDPRPNRQTIHLAYQDYGTHESQLDDDPQQPGTDWRSSLKQAILRAYIRVRFSKKPFKPSDVFAGAMWFRPFLRPRFDAAMRHLPVSIRPGTVLDIGCGNGRFLAWARIAGWRGCGTEFDSQAAAVARSKGFDIHEGPLDELVNSGKKFDAVTISHVIEHVHEPSALLRAAHQLLKPGGHFWIETPNINARGHAYFGAGWAGLHPPHHLQVFAPKALERLLREAGFIDIRIASSQSGWRAMASLSRPTDPKQMRNIRSQAIREDIAEFLGHSDAAEGECITLTATVSA